jgi:hypothetical protein
MRALKARAAESGLSLSGFLRGELERIASRPTNAQVLDRLARRSRKGGPTVADTVAEIRRTRKTS